MEILCAALCGFLLDLLLGDPVWMPHPVVGMGRCIDLLERILRRVLPQTPRGELAAGAVLAAVLSLGTLGLSALALYLCGLIHPDLRFGLSALWCWQCLAVKGLKDESANVYRKLSNSAQTEAAMAGALGVRLAGPASYFGKVCDKPTIGDPLRPIEAEDILRAKRPRQALIVEPTFSGYEEALRAAGCQIERFFLAEADGFVLTETLLPCIKPGLDLLFLCTPNNPTGRTADRALLAEILARCRDYGTLLVLDECFSDFLDTPEVHSLVGEVETHPNLFVLRSFTKWYSMAGLRLGYAICSDVKLLERMRRRGPPWPVSAPAQAAGLAGLGCRVIPGEANFLLFYCPDISLDRKLEKQGILIRNCSDFPGLGPGWYRAAVRTGDENQALLLAIREVL